MREFIDVTGKTEEEAINKALAQLGMDRDDVSVEILERAKSGFLGLGSSPARVRVSYGPEEEETPAPVAEAPKAEVKKAPEKAPEKRPERKPEKKAEKPASVKPAPAPKKETAPAADNGEEVDDEKAQAIKKFLSGLLDQMECPAQVHV